MKTEETVVRVLKEKGLTLFAAESCTGGLVCKRMTDVPGASAVLRGGVVCYTDEVKHRFLSVSEQTLASFTAVSAECAEEMAIGARERSGADLGVSATGYASGGEGVPQELVGTVFIGFSSKEGTKVKRLCLKGNRSRVREAAAEEIFAMILEYSKGE